MQILSSFDTKFMVMHSVVIVDNYIVFNVSYVSKVALPPKDVVRLYNEYLIEAETYE